MFVEISTTSLPNPILATAFVATKHPGAEIKINDYCHRLLITKTTKRSKSIISTF